MVDFHWVLLVLRVVAVAVLYGFLVVVVYTIWRDLRLAGASAHSLDAVVEPVSRDLPGRLCAVTGDGLSPPGDVFALSSPLTIGRAADNHIVLADDLVSLRHARIDRRDEEWWLTDLDSRNGTRLNDVIIARPAPLADGDIVGIGTVRLRFESENRN